MGKKKILIVDDDKTILVIIKGILEEEYDIVGVTGGEMAISYLRDNIPDLILLDVAMPDMDGYQVMDIIRDGYKMTDIPIVFLTGINDPEEEVRAFEHGADDFISKPVNGKVMLHRIKRLIELYELRRQLEDKIMEMEEKIDSISLIPSGATEPLTGLYNRAYLEKTTKKLLNSNKNGVFFMMDMDDFKSINDMKGHIIGDHVLKVFGNILRSVFRDDDILCRMGGDEFAVYMPGRPGRKIIEEKLSKFINEVKDNADIAACGMHANVSVGVAIAPDDADNFEDLYACADKALYHVKKNGKNMYHFYGVEPDEIDVDTTKTDMMYIKKMLDGDLETDFGALAVEYEEFRQIYNYVCRYVNRNENQVQILLFTIRAKKGKLLEAQFLAQAMSRLKEAVVESLRKVDVGTQYSHNQYIVILTDSNAVNGEMVAKRVVNEFYRTCDKSVAVLGYDMQEITPKKRHFVF